jgi:hypothetical protein
LSRKPLCDLPFAALEIATDHGDTDISHTTVGAPTRGIRRSYFMRLEHTCEPAHQLRFRATRKQRASH